MFVITNRKLKKADGLHLFRDTPNAKGPNELRIVEVHRTSGGRWKTTLLDDKLTSQQKKSLEEAGLSLPKGETLYASHYAAGKILSQAKKEKKNILLFVHGYNNNVKSVLERARRLEKNFGVIVVPFSWPANGGGNVFEDVAGVLSYKSDKRDARASSGAFDRCLSKIYARLDWFNRRIVAEAEKEAAEKFGDDLESRREYVAAESTCPFKVSLFLHSMGNYLLKSTMSSSAFLSSSSLIFDNVVLCAADANNLDHPKWVDPIRYRNRLLITINEDDKALRLSRLKVGDRQLARLGHTVRNLTSEEAVYVDFTSASWVRDSHAYFESNSLQNDHVKTFFKAALNGERAEETLPARAWSSSKNLFRVP